jgi:acetyltransferase-like isoleucine patch superfamily enzyme
VVTKPIPDYSIAAGVPAQVIRSRQTAQGEGPASAGPRSRAG